ARLRRITLLRMIGEPAANSPMPPPSVVTLSWMTLSVTTGAPAPPRKTPPPSPSCGPRPLRWMMLCVISGAPYCSAIPAPAQPAEMRGSRPDQPRTTGTAQPIHKPDTTTTQTATHPPTAWLPRRCNDLISPSPLLGPARPRTFGPERETTRHRYQDGLPVAHL